MGSMKDFWAREWLLSHIGEQHKTNDLNAALEIAQREGYLEGRLYDRARKPLCGTTKRNIRSERILVGHTKQKY